MDDHDGLVSPLVDVTAIPLTELLRTQDPAILAAIEWVIAQLLDENPQDGCC